MTVNTNHVATPQPIDAFLTFWERWIALWNGNLKLAERIIAEEFIRNLPGKRGIQAHRTMLIELIKDVRSRYPGAELVVEAGPLISQGLVVGRWSLICPPELGRRNRESTLRIAGGTDILRVDDGRIVECWTSTDLCTVGAESRRLNAS